ncbi:sulfatase [Acidobacteriota bacterium]
MFFLSFFYCLKSKEDFNYILITLDTQRADYISSYNPLNASTPNIDSLAQLGTRYENCFSLIPITLPSHASLFFSEPPYEIKNYNNGQVISERKKHPSLPALFQKNGFQTSAFISLGVLKSQFGLSEGFDVYHDEFPENRWYLTAGEVNGHVFDWLDTKEEGKFFTWVHYSDPHDPYYPPEMPAELTIHLDDKPVGLFNLGKYENNEIELHLKTGKNIVRFDIANDSMEDQDGFLARLDTLDFSVQPDDKDIKIDMVWGWFIRQEKRTLFFKKNAMIAITNLSAPQEIKMKFRGKPYHPIERTRELYRSEVEYMDNEIGKLLSKLKELGLMDNTHILVVGDHGEGLGEYKNYVGDLHVGHVHFLQNVYNHVPLIIYNPLHSNKSSVRKEYVSLLDIAPTIIDTMKFKNIPDYMGRNLNKLRNKSRYFLLQETYKPEAGKEKFALMKYPWHLIFTPEDQAYELYDLENDFDENTDIYSEDSSEKISDLKVKLDEFSRKILRSKEEVKIGKDVEEMLKALGYIK